MAIQPAGPSRARLSIAHLMLWTLGSAIILACFRTLRGSDDEVPEVIQFWRPLHDVCYSLILGAQVGSLLLFAARRVSRRSGFPDQPGHWLLMIEGIYFLLWFAAISFRSALQGVIDLATLSIVFFLLALPCFLASTIGYGAACVSTARGSPWRAAFAILAVVHAIQALLTVLSAVSLFIESSWVVAWLMSWEFLNRWSGLVMGLAVLFASLADWRLHVKRDFLHWTGLVAFLGYAAIGLAYRMLVIGS